MKIITEEFEGKIRFSISNFDLKYQEIFKMCFYSESNGVYYKDFSVDYQYIDNVRKNFELSAVDMFKQLGYFSEIPWEDALKLFCQKIEGYDIDWWLTGSCASCLRGIPLKPHDIDIMVDSKDIHLIENLFAEYLIEPIVNTGGWLTKDFGVIFLKARIDIASDPVESLDIPIPIDCGPTAKKNLETIHWEGFDIRIPPLELQLNANKRRKRVDRIKLIESYIASIK
ncbi:nucleotidyltransferase domain-containing protein [Maledivibacter halophilus]|uniref:Uncharacterized protein n=1 Tax=Maledivibacter halophilus TaxID=36842 RepID=A0A1T5M9Q9_9FIRM|nr:hypothetical protein [Maledivibacter halophilus]SKC84599.1 hypothetical protein SAMN02194393_04180 [Maledivibacter halophilus]